jgi:cAMP phosphodiesterase
MSEFETNNGHVQALIPLKLKPNIHEACASITGDETVLYGHYTMEYLLPKGDKLRIIANHNQKTAQLILLTHDASLIQQLPGARPSSLIANAISQINS